MSLVAEVVVEVRMAAESAQQSELGPTHFLVVEDDEHLASLLGRWVQDHYGDGATVHTAHSIDEATTVISELSALDIVLLDRHFPRGTGVDLLDTLYDQFDPIVIMVTGVEPSTELIRFPVADYLVKPIERPALIKRVSLLEKLRTSGALDAYSDARKASLLEFHLDDPDADPLFRRFAARWTYERLEVAAGEDDVYVYELYTNDVTGIDISVAGRLKGNVADLVADGILRPVGEVLPSGRGFAWIDVDREDVMEPSPNGLVIYEFDTDFPEQHISLLDGTDASDIAAALEDAYR